MTLASPLKTVMGRHGSIIRKGGNGETKLVRANGTDIFLGAAVTYTGETRPDVDLCAKGEQMDGIIIGPAYTALDLDKDSDSCFADNTWLIMYIPLPGDEIYMTAKTNTSITVNVRIQIDGGFIIPWAYVDGAEVTDTLESVIGKSLTAVTGAASTEAVVCIKIGSA